MTNCKRTALAFFAALCASACATNEIGTGVGNPPTSTTTKIAAAVANLFSSGADSTTLVRGVIRFQTGASDGDCVGSPAECMCYEIVNGTGNAPDFVENAAFANQGTYGSAARSITVESDDFCTLPDGTENPEEGPDGSGRFGFFEIVEDIQVSCTGGSESEANELTFETGSSGIMRNTAESESAPAYQPQIYATFLVSAEDSEAAPFDCTVYLKEDATTDFVDCSDENGVSVTQETDVTCEFPGS